MGRAACTPQLTRAVVAGCRVPQDRLDEHARWLREALVHAAADERPTTVSSGKC